MRVIEHNKCNPCNCKACSSDEDDARAGTSYNQFPHDSFIKTLSLKTFQMVGIGCLAVLWCGVIVRYAITGLQEHIWSTNLWKIRIFTIPIS
ncbi:hypothetical protein TNCV_2680261 [Trichonephila clavipes]|uniref:Uncharacterized protein n=1 Tax=Trichonephila clavipes TaxID=2585209 RepID=A0A8X6V640_TRICX|nr:hypothetical protein TNCV_2680261 [Trichonephila clavipes]